MCAQITVNLRADIFRHLISSVYVKYYTIFCKLSTKMRVPAVF